MKTITDAEFKDSCSKKNIHVNGRDIFYEKLRLKSIFLKLPTSALSSFGLAHVLLGYLQEDKYGGSLYWLVETGMWSEDTEAVGQYFLKKINDGVDIEPNFRHWVFKAEDIVQQKSLLLLTMLFQWDAFLIPNHGHHIISLNHDGYIRVYCDSSYEQNKALRLLSEWGPTLD